MEQVNFNNLNLEQRAALVFLSGEYISDIRYYGFKVCLYIVHGNYIEVFYNIHNNQIEEIEPLNPDEGRLHLYTNEVDIKSLFD